MSDQISPIISERIAKLKTYEGKTFVRKDGKGFPIKIIKYDGIKTANGISAHTFLVCSKDARWTPQATAFLEEHDEVEIPETKSNEGVI